MSVFISYSMHDKQKLARVVGELRSRGVVGENDQLVYAPDVFVPGSSMRGQVRDAIAAASKVVVVWSDAGAGSDWVNYETGMAEALGKPIYIVIPKGAASRVPAGIEHLQVLEVDNVR